MEPTSIDSHINKRQIEALDNETHLTKHYEKPRNETRFILRSI